MPSPTKTARQVTSAMRLTVGMPLQAKWGSEYYRVRVLELIKTGEVKIHWDDWSDAFDEVVERSRLWVEPADLAKNVKVKSESKKRAAKAGETAASPAPGGLRTWTNSSGKFKIEAELIGFENGKVRLKRADGKEISLPIEKLSDADQQFVRSEQPPASISK